MDKEKYFNRKEFACKCGCGKDDVSLWLVEKLDRLRELYGKPIVISSGCRCEEYNAKVGGVTGSAHTKGLAADISVNKSQDRYEILSRIIRGHLFKRIGIGKSFLHVDIDSDKPQTVIWVY